LRCLRERRPSAFVKDDGQTAVSLRLRCHLPQEGASHYTL